MKKAWTVGILMLLAGLLIVPILIPSESRAEGTVRRFAANFSLMDGGEAEALSTDTASSGGLGGVTIYDNLVTVPADVNVLYVTISATGDTESGARELLSCLVDGKPCTLGAASCCNESLSGWVNVHRHPARTDFEDESILYSWCTPIKKLKPVKKVNPSGLMHEVSLSLASSGESNVFVEAMHVFVDGSHVDDPAQRCTDADTGFED